MILLSNRASGILYKYLRSNPGRYVIPANVCPIIPLVFKAANVCFDFVDIDRNTLCIDKNQLEKKLRCGCDGVLYVRTYGCIDDLESYFAFLKDSFRGCRIIDDRCLCLPNMSSSSSYADLILFSTGYAKQVDLGYGGLGLLSDTTGVLNDFNLVYSGCSIEPYYKECILKGKKIDAMPLGWLDTGWLNLDGNVYISQIEERIKELKTQKDRINCIYRTNLPQEIQLNKKFQSWRFNIITKEKNKILDALFANGLFASSHYYPVNKLFDDGFFENSSWLYDNVVNLFNDNYYSEVQAIKTCEVICRIIS